MPLDRRVSHALSLMEEALHLLDEVGFSPDVGAHLDLAIHRLKDEMTVPDKRSGYVLRVN